MCWPLEPTFFESFGMTSPFAKIVRIDELEGFPRIRCWCELLICSGGCRLTCLYVQGDWTKECHRHANHDLTPVRTILYKDGRRPRGLSFALDLQWGEAYHKCVHSQVPSVDFCE